MDYTFYRIPIRPVTKKNSQQIILVNGRPRITQSRQYKKYEREALKFLRPVALPIDYSVNVKCTYWLHPNKDGSLPKRLPDLPNLLNATDDVLIVAGILKDDNCMIVRTHDGSIVMFDKDHTECTEIEITRLEAANG